MTLSTKVESVNELTYIEVVEDSTTVEVLEEIVDIIEVAVQGPQGIPGVGIPTGGEYGQILTKKSNDDYDLQWINTDSQIMEIYDKNNNGKIDEAEVADLALNSNLIGGRSITEFYDKTEINTITSRYTYIQPIATADWIVTHNLGRFPSGVTVVDSAGSVIEGSIQFINSNSIKISFNYAFSGKAYIG